MVSSISSAARELERLVSRAARRGRLTVDELLDTYVELQPDSHPLLANPRRVDREAMLTAVRALPPHFLTTRQVLLVPRLDAYECEIVPACLPAAGRLPDDTLLLECLFGLTSLLNLATQLCVLAHEARKSRRLLATPQPPDRTGFTFAEIAFTLGLDPESLAAADDETDGELVGLLLGTLQLPEVKIHADLSPEMLSERASRQAHRVLARLAEMGLASRRLHLWLGSPLVTDCLSPYTRDLRDVLTRWAQTHPETLGEDLAGPLAQPNADQLYAVAHDFLRTDPDLERERREADRTVGILRFDPRGQPFELVDLSRVDPTVCDARLMEWPAREGLAPVLIRMSPDLADPAAVGLRTLLSAIGAQLDGITVLLEGTALSGQTGTLVFPELMVRWSGEEKLSIPDTRPPADDELASYAYPAIEHGALLSTTSVALLSFAPIAHLAQTFNVRAVEIGGSHLVSALADARWSEQVSRSMPIRWGLVSSRLARTGRPSLASLAATRAVAIATLRQIVAGDAPKPQPVAPDPEPPPKGPSRRAVRIRA